MTYRPRIADAELATRLASTGAVVIEGPKACGKTETARQLAASEVLLDIDDNARQALAIEPKLVLDGKTPRLIDEWQIEPAIWNHIRRTVDERGLPGQFILTGSAVPADDITPVVTLKSPTCGRVKIPHLRRVSTLSDRAKLVYRFWIERSILFPFFIQSIFYFRFINGANEALGPVASFLPNCHHIFADSLIALIQTRSYVNISGVIPA